MAIQAPTDFILKAYTTEALAREGDESKALRINDPDDEEGSIVNNASQDGSTDYSGFFAFQRYWYRIEANEPVKEFHIDWDDGADNSPEKANVTIIKNDKPQFVGITSHIYTQAKAFYPLLRVKSIDGFLSKWYAPHASNGSSAVASGYDFSGLDDDIKLTGSSGQLHDKGQNDFSIVCIEKNDDSTDYARIPVLKPANVPPVGVLKADRKRVFSGLDNTWIGNNSRLLYSDSTEYPYTSTIHAVCSNQNRTQVPVKVTYQEGIYGGVSAVSEVSTTAYGTYNVGGNRGYNGTDLEDKVIYYYTMDECYGIYFTWSGQGGVNSSPPGMEVTDAVATATQIPEQSGNASNAYVTADDIAAALESALDSITYYGNAEFTSSNASGHETRYVITTTHLSKGELPDVVLGSGAEVLFEPQDEAVGSPNYFAPRWTTTGVDASDGTVKQQTITTDVNADNPPVYGSSARITNVAKVLRMELTDVRENTDTAHTGTTGQAQLAPGERVFLQSSINYASATINPIATHRIANPNMSGTIGFVSLGNPIMELDSIGSYVTVDATESKLRTSNKSVSSYYIDDNKLMSGDNTTFTVGGASYNNDPTITHTSSTDIKVGQPVSGTGIPTGAYVAMITSATSFELSASTTGGSLSSQTLTFNGNLAQHQKTDYTYNITDAIVDGSDFKTSDGVRDIRYSFDWWRDFQDANYRFYPQKRLVRCQVQDDHTQAADDGYNRSPIRHWDSASYISTGAGVGAAADAAGLPTEISKHNYGALLFTNRAKLRSPEWFNLNVANRSDRWALFGSDNAEEHTLLCSTAYDTLTTSAHYKPDNVGNADKASVTDADTVGPRNAIFMAQKEQFDRIFVRVSHDRLTEAGLNMNTMSTRVDNTPGSQDLPAVRVQVLYPAKKTKNSSTISWKPLKVIDRTKLKGKDNSTFYLSGDISFLPPSDWEKTKHSTSIEYPYESNFYMDKGAGAGTGLTTADGIDDHWTEDSYALIFLITHIDSDGDASGLETTKPIFNVMSMYPFNNSHSQLIEITDPMHISLNKYMISQSVSFTRKGKYQEIKDRSGISQLRRIGADNGTVKLGSIDLKNDSTNTRVKFHEFQQDAVPVYYDLTHADDSITRLFGVLTDMSEDFPTAKVIPKFAMTMQITHTLEINSSGVIQDDGYVPLGGDVIDVGQYLSAV